ncbi:uncharacterized protein G2W53_019401 [Senna tora]|uniref:Uncharacterized protein n=1 Tax=Senna tora TaxID=362788 RepID=A0A834TVJ0_9FABA|nr:uncharacterized protein G2W53_019401 [Senna tora]
MGWKSGIVREHSCYFYHLHSYYRRFHLKLVVSLCFRRVITTVITITVMYKSGPTLLAGINRLKQILQAKGLASSSSSSSSWGMMGATSIPKKQANNEGEIIRKENIDPIVAFSRPPPFPPIVGPLVALTLLETWFENDADDEL